MEMFPEIKDAEVMWGLLHPELSTDNLNAIGVSWTANEMRNLTFQIRPKKLESATEKESRKKALKAQVQKVVLLDLVMPNGKPLRDCKGKDLTRIGGWAGKLAKMLKPNEIVGKVLKESTIRKVWSGR